MFWRGWRGQRGVGCKIFPFFVGKSACIEHVFEYKDDRAGDAPADRA